MTKKSLLVIILALLILSAAASTAQAVEIVKSVPFNGPPIMAYDSYKGAVWVTTYYSYTSEFLGMPLSKSTNTVSAISDSNNKVLANVTVGKNPIMIAYASALHEVYVSSQDSGTISVISDISNSVVATIDLNKNQSYGDRPVGGSIVYDSGKGEIFGTYPGGVFVISEKTKQVVATIPLGNNPAPNILTYDSGKGEIFVSYSSLSDQNPANFMSVISDTTNSVIATIPLDRGITSPGAYDSATGEIYFPAQNGSVIVVSDKTHSVIDSIPLEYFPICVAYDPVKSVLFVGAAHDTTYIISDRTRSVIETVPISSVFMVYDTGKNLMLAMGNSSIQFVSDDSLPSPPPTPTPTPTASPSVFKNPVFLGLDWVQIAIIVLMSIIVVAVAVAAFMFLSKKRGTEQTEPA